MANESCIEQLQWQPSCLKLKEVANKALETQSVCFNFSWELIIDSHSIAIVWICTFESLEGSNDILICRVCHLFMGHSVPDWKI